MQEEDLTRELHRCYLNIAISSSIITTKRLKGRFSYELKTKTKIPNYQFCCGHQVKSER